MKKFQLVLLVIYVAAQFLVWIASTFTVIIQLIKSVVGLDTEEGFKKSRQKINTTPGAIRAFLLAKNWASPYRRKSNTHRHYRPDILPCVFPALIRP